MKRASSDEGGVKAKFACLFANAASRRPDPDQEPYKSLGAGTGLILEPEDSLKEALAQEKEEI